MNKKYDINLILPQEVFEENRKNTLKRDVEIRKQNKKKEIKRWIMAIIQAPFVMAGVYFIYCFMYLVIGG